MPTIHHTPKRCIRFPTNVPQSRAAAQINNYGGITSISGSARYRHFVLGAKLPNTARVVRPIPALGRRALRSCS